MAGQKLSGSVPWTATPSGKTVAKIDFKIDGSVKWTEASAPWVFNGDGRTLDTTSLANGAHALAVVAYATDGTSATTSAMVSVSNAAPKPSAAPELPASAGTGPSDGKTAAPTLTTPAAPATLEVKPYVIEWDGRLFQTMGTFRSYLMGIGTDWSGFLRKHPDIAETTGLPFVQWDGKKFYDQASLARKLAKRKNGYREWASKHPFAAASLAGVPVAGAQRTEAQVLQKPVAITWAGVGFTTANGLRSYIMRQGADWNTFLVGHPAAAQRLALASVTWEGKRFYTRAALSRWFTEHHGTLAQWQKAHPGLAEKLMG